MKAKKNNKIKRIVAIYLAVVFVISAVAVFGVSAVTNTYEHYIEVGMDDSVVTYGARLTSTGRMSETFPSYPYIYSGYSSSVNKARAVNTSTRTLNDWQQFTLYANGGGVVTLTYGTNLSVGLYEIQYKHVSQGGFKDDIILSLTY